MCDSNESLRKRMSQLEGQVQAQELELDRAHAWLDRWGLPREVPGEDGRPLELSITGRLERLEFSEEDYGDEDSEDPEQDAFKHLH